MSGGESMLDGGMVLLLCGNKKALPARRVRAGLCAAAGQGNPPGSVEIGSVRLFEFGLECLDPVGLLPGEVGPAEVAVGRGRLVDGPFEVQRGDDSRR